MSDRYLGAISHPLARKLTRALGLPQPVRLRRFEPDAPLTGGPVLVLSNEKSRPQADDLAAALLDWELEVRRASAHGVPALEGGAKWGAVVVVVTAASHPRDLAAPILELGGMLRELAASGRVITVSRESLSACKPEQAAARAAVGGLVRSLGKELRAGATANGLVLADGVALTSPAALGTLQFFLSARSAFVSGQCLHVSYDGAAGRSPSNPQPVAVVTGAARGIGAAISRVLAREGARVIGVDVPAAGEALAGVMNEVGGKAVQLDITSPLAAERLVAAAGGLPDIVVHNAGILRDKLLANMTPERWNDLIEVNIAAPLALNAHFLELARELGRAPRVVSLASTSGIAGNRGQTNYAAAKAGVIGMTADLAAAFHELGGSINAVAPGFIETEMTAKIPPLARQVARRVNSLQQGGLPVDVAEAVAFLVSDAALGIVGQTLRVCGQNVVGR